MTKRTYSKCEWCKTTIDITTNESDLCEECAKYPNRQARDMAQINGELRTLRTNGLSAELEAQRDLYEAIRKNEEERDTVKG